MYKSEQSLQSYLHLKLNNSSFLYFIHSQFTKEDMDSQNASYNAGVTKGQTQVFFPLSLHKFLHNIFSSFTIYKKNIYFIACPSFLNCISGLVNKMLYNSYGINFLMLFLCFQIVRGYKEKCSNMMDRASNTVQSAQDSMQEVL